MIDEKKVKELAIEQYGFNDWVLSPNAIDLVEVIDAQCTGQSQTTKNIIKMVAQITMNCYALRLAEKELALRGADLQIESLRKVVMEHGLDSEVIG